MREKPSCRPMVQVGPATGRLYSAVPIGHEVVRASAACAGVIRFGLPICWVRYLCAAGVRRPLIADETTSNEPVFQRIERERGFVIANAQIRIFASSIEGELASAPEGRGRVARS